MNERIKQHFLNQYIIVFLSLFHCLITLCLLRKIFRYINIFSSSFLYKKYKVLTLGGGGGGDLFFAQSMINFGGTHPESDKKFTYKRNFAKIW